MTQTIQLHTKRNKALLSDGFKKITSKKIFFLNLF